MCTWVGFYENTRASFIELSVYFGSVPTEHVDDLNTKFKQSLQRIIKDGMDMERMKLVLNKDRLKVCAQKFNHTSPARRYSELSIILVPQRS